MTVFTPTHAKTFLTRAGLVALSAACIGLNPSPALANSSTSHDVVYPPQMQVRSILDLGAKGDGKHDDTKALQQAMNLSGVTYFPAGTYLVTDTILMTGKTWVGPALRGQHKDKVTIKLSPKAKGFDNPKKIKPVVAFFKMKGHTADLFKFNMADMTVDTGDHKGALAVRFHSNNNGMIRDVHITGKGAIGLDLSSGHNGPLLVRNVSIDGFAVGLNAGSGPYNSQTVDGLVLRNQTKWGIYNDREALFMRRVDFEGNVPFLYAFGTNTLIDSVAKGKGVKGPAITAIDRFFARNVKIEGFDASVKVGKSSRDKKKKLVFDFKKELITDKVLSDFTTGSNIATPGNTGKPKTLGLKVPDQVIPPMPKDYDTWVFVDDFGADPTDKKDDSDAIQKAIDAAAKRGSTTVAFRGNSLYSIDKGFRIHGSVNRLQGAASMMRPTAKGIKTAKIIIEKGKGDMLTFEGIDRPLGGQRVHLVFKGGRDMYVRRFRAQLHAEGPGDIFLEDSVAMMRIKHKGAKVWSRQCNAESRDEINIINDGGSLWILGLKTERNQSYVQSMNGAQTELLGGWLYNTINKPPTAPMFTADDTSKVSIVGMAYYNFWGKKFPLSVQMKRGGKDLSLSQETLRPQIDFFSTETR